jgi:hypothetical protein
LTTSVSATTRRARQRHSILYVAAAVDRRLGFPKSPPGGAEHRGGEALTSRFDVSVVATPLQAFDAIAETQVSFAPRHFSHSAGLAVLYDNKNFAFLRLCSSGSLRSIALGVVLVKDGTKQELLADRAVVDSDGVVLQAEVQHGTLQFGWRTPNEASFDDIGPNIEATYMSDETTRGFTGTMIGMACVDCYRRNVLAHFATSICRMAHISIEHWSVSAGTLISGCPITSNRQGAAPRSRVAVSTLPSRATSKAAATSPVRPGTVTVARSPSGNSYARSVTSSSYG